MGRTGRGDSLAALQAAREAGITFFDTARSYGYGESESLLGEFVKGHRDETVLCTKFGILPPPRDSWKQKIKPMAQAAIRIFPRLRSFAQRQAGGEVRGGQFSISTLRASFETSLRCLQTDYVDMLLLHGATLEVLDQDDLLEAMQRLVEQGKARMAGISGEHSVIAETFRRRPGALTTAQFAVNRACLAFTSQTAQPNAQKLFLVANHPFGGPSGVLTIAAGLQALCQTSDVTEGLREKLVAGDPQLMPELLLNVILQGTGISAVVPAMMRFANLKSNVGAIDHCRFTADELIRLRQLLIAQNTSIPADEAQPGDPPGAWSTPSA